MHGRSRLEHVGVEPIIRLAKPGELSAEIRDDADGRAQVPVFAEAVRITQRDIPLAALYFVPVAEARGLQAGCFDAQDRQVAARIGRG